RAGAAGVLPRAPGPLRPPPWAAGAAPPRLPPGTRQEPRAPALGAPRAAARDRPSGAPFLSPFPAPGAVRLNLFETRKLGAGAPASGAFGQTSRGPREARA